MQPLKNLGWFGSAILVRYANGSAIDSCNNASFFFLLLSAGTAAQPPHTRADGQPPLTSHRDRSLRLRLCLASTPPLTSHQLPGLRIHPQPAPVAGCEPPPSSPGVEIERRSPSTTVFTAIVIRNIMSRSYYFAYRSEHEQGKSSLVYGVTNANIDTSNFVIEKGKVMGSSLKSLPKDRSCMTIHRRGIFISLKTEPAPQDHSKHAQKTEPAPQAFISLLEFVSEIYQKRKGSNILNFIRSTPKIKTNATAETSSVAFYQKWSATGWLPFHLREGDHWLPSLMDSDQLVAFRRKRRPTGRLQFSGRRGGKSQALPLWHGGHVAAMQRPDSRLKRKLARGDSDETLIHQSRITSSRSEDRERPCERSGYRAATLRSVVSLVSRFNQLG
nr:nuclear pore complex protein NUP205 isoform X2 [Ipomoea batatas]